MNNYFLLRYELKIRLLHIYIEKNTIGNKKLVKSQQKSSKMEFEDI